MKEILMRPRSTVIITGGSRGIGRMIAEDLIKDYELILIARTKPELEKTQKEVGGSIEAVDICDLEALKAALSRHDLRHLKGVVNCAGVLGPQGKFGDLDMKEWAEAVRINLVGTANIMHAALPYLNDTLAGRPKIVNIGGGGSAYPRPNYSAYAASKTAAVRLTENIAKEYPEIDVNIIAPGAHKTKMWEINKLEEEPKKWGDPKRLQSLIRYLLSEKSNKVTGKFIHIYDSWESFDKSVSDGPEYTIRRIERRED